MAVPECALLLQASTWPRHLPRAKAQLWVPSLGSPHVPRRSISTPSEPSCPHSRAGASEAISRPPLLHLTRGHRTACKPAPWICRQRVVLHTRSSPRAGPRGGTRGLAHSLASPLPLCLVLCPSHTPNAHYLRNFAGTASSA